MATKGQIMTQVHYDKEQRYLAVLKEALRRGEVSRDEAVKALRSMGFSIGTSAIKVKEWTVNTPQLEAESKGVMSKRQKEMVSLENYFFKKKGIKEWNEETKKWVLKKKKNL